MRSLSDRSSGGKSLILVGIDFSGTSRSVLTSAEELAARTPGSELHLVHAFGASISSPDLGGQPALPALGFIGDSESAKAALEKLATATSRRTKRVTAHVQVGTAANVIADLANDIGADLIVVGRHARAGVSRLLFGSVAEKLLRVAPCPVLMVRARIVRAWEHVAPPCPACNFTRRVSGGSRLWCNHHAQRHPRAHTYYKALASYGIGAQTFRNN